MRLSQASSGLVPSVIRNPLLLKSRIHPFNTYAKISYTLLRTRACAYQGTKNVILSEMFAHVLSGCFPIEA